MRKVNVSKGGVKMKILKKVLSVLLATVLISSLMPVTAYALDTEPYLISTAQDLEEFRNLVNSGQLDLDAKLTNNIVLNENFEQEKFAMSDDGTVTYNGVAVPDSFTQWVPIGDSYGNYYNGVFDGDGHTISGLYINSESYEQALFGCVGSNGTVKNLGITNSFIYSYAYAGGVVATNNNGSVVNCFNDGIVCSSDTVGGIVAYGMGTLTNCYNSGEIKATSGNAGGVIGANYGDVTSCYNTGKVTGDYYIGGVVGFNDSTVSNCYNTGAISGNEQVGGVVGYNAISMENCYNAGVVTGSTDFGSVSGYNEDADMNNCYYLEGTAKENDPSAISKTAEQFESGEVAYLLQNGQSADTVWGQEIGKDKYPVINGLKVYKNQRYQGCVGNPGEIISYYSNEEKALEYGEHSYSEGGVCKYCNDLENGKDGFKSASLTLTDGVIINYYVFFSDEAKEDENAYIKFTSVNGINKQIKLSNGVKDGERYKFSLELRPDQMSDEITAQVVYSDGSTGSSVVYSVKKYADKVENTDTSKALVDAMLSYGAFSQLYTGKNTDDLVTDVSDYTQNAVVGENYKYNLSNNTQGITIKSATLQLGASVTIRMKLHLEDGADISKFTIKCDNKILIPEKSGNDYYVYLKNIAPQDFDEMHSFTVSDGTNTSVLEYSVFSYMKNILDNAASYDKKLVNLMNSMYDYNKEAESYIG